MSREPETNIARIPNRRARWGATDDMGMIIRASGSRPSEAFTAEYPSTAWRN
jgi:hypothetical protein